MTSRLCQIRSGEEVLIAKIHKGTLVASDLAPREPLLLFATGTGVAPFVSILRNQSIFQRFKDIVLVHGVRLISELA